MGLVVVTIGDGEGGILAGYTYDSSEEERPLFSFLPDAWDDPRRRPRLRVSPALSRTVIERDGPGCQHCGTEDNPTIDHVIPVVRGGTNDLDNLQVLCGSCNSRKGARV